MKLKRSLLCAVGLGILSLVTIVRADYVSVVNADTPVGWWRFEDATTGNGDTATNVGTTGATNDGAFRGSVTTAASYSPLLGQAASFNGSSTYVDLGFNMRDALGGASAVTVEAWVKNSTLPENDPNNASHFIYRTVIDGTNTGVRMAINPTSPEMNLGGRAVTSDTFQSGGASYGDTGNWHHVVGVMDFANDQIRVYIDGVGITTGVSFSDPFAADSTDTHHDSIGANEGITGWERFFDGLIDEVAVYNYALGEDRILAHFAAAIPEPSSLLLLGCAALSLLRGRRGTRRRNRTTVLAASLVLACMLSTRALAATVPVTSNLAVWLDASDVDGDGLADSLSTGDPVSTWVNKGTLGVGNAVTATEESGDAPLYLTDGGAPLGNLPALDFDGNSSGLKIADNTNLDATTGLTVFVVSDYEGGGFRFGQKGNGFGTGAGDWFLSPNSGLGVAGMWQSPAFTDGVGTHIFELVFDPGSGTNGGILNLLDGDLRGPELLLASAYASPNSDPLFLGRRYNPIGSEGWLDGQIAEFLIYNTVLSEDDRNAVGFYLKTKYGIDAVYTPEPTTTALLVTGAALLLRRRSPNR